MWVLTIKATSVTQDTAVDSLSAATTTMNSGVSSRLGGGGVSWCPGIPVTAFAPWETFCHSFGGSVGGQNLFLGSRSDSSVEEGVF